MNQNTPEVFLDRKFVKILLTALLGKKNMLGKSLEILKTSNPNEINLIRVLFVTRVQGDDARLVRFKGLVDLHCNNATKRQRFK